MNIGMGRVHQGNNAVQQVTLTQLFINKEGLCDRGRIGQPGALNDQSIEGDLATVQPLKQQVQRFGQVGVNGAAHTAIGQGHDLHRLVAQQLGVDARIAELIFDHGDFQPVFSLEHMTQQGGFTGPQKTAEDGNGDWRRHAEVSRTAEIKRGADWLLPLMSCNAA